MVNVRYNLALVGSQVEELEKLARINTRALRPIGAAISRLSWPASADRAMNIGRLAGAGLGAVGGGVLGAQTAPQTGDPATDAAARRSAILSGAVGGGALGLGAGQLATGRGRQWLGNRLKIQAHGMTGWVPGSKALGGSFTGKGLSGAKRLDLLRDIEMNIPTSKSKLDMAGDALKKVRSGVLSKYLPEGGRLQKGLAGLGARQQAARLAQVEGGYTSIPGIARGLVTRPGETLKTNLMAAGPVGLAMPLAFGVPGVVQGVREKDPESVARALGETAAYTVGGGLPMLGTMALASGVGRLSAAPAQVYRRLRGQPTPEVPTQAAPQTPIIRQR